MENNTKMMVRNNRVIPIAYNEEGSPFVAIKDPLTDKIHYAPIDPRVLGEVEDHPYAINVETIAYEDLSKRIYEFVYKDEAKARDAMKRYVIGEEFLDDEKIVDVKGPTKKY